MCGRARMRASRASTRKDARAGDRLVEGGGVDRRTSRPAHPVSAAARQVAAAARRAPKSPAPASPAHREGSSSGFPLSAFRPPERKTPRAGARRVTRARLCSKRPDPSAFVHQLPIVLELPDRQLGAQHVACADTGTSAPYPIKRKRHVPEHGRTPDLVARRSRRSPPRGGGRSAQRPVPIPSTLRGKGARSRRALPAAG